MNFQTKIFYFLTSGISGDITVDAVRKAILVNTFCILGSIFPLIFIIISLADKNYSYSIILVTLLCLFFSIFVFLKITKNIAVASHALLSINLIFFLYLIIGLSGHDNTAPFWLYIFPPLALFLTNLRTGFFFTMFLFIATLISVNTLPWLQNSFPVFYKIRYFSTLSAIALLCFIFEYIREKTHSLLTRTNETVQLQNAELKIQKEEIRQQFEEISSQRDNLSAIYNELTLKNLQIVDSIEYAKIIQNAILPDDKILKESFSDFFILHEPRDIIGGDFYWIYKSCNKIYFAAADCTGHGVPGAFMSMIGYTLLTDIVRQRKIFSPAEILSHLNEEIIEALNQKGDLKSIQEDGMDISVCCFDFESKELTIASANFYTAIKQNENISLIESDIYSIGGYLSMRQEITFTEKKFPLKNGVILYFFSDGFQDQLGGDQNKKFGINRFNLLINEHMNLNFNEQKKNLQNILNEWKGERNQTDDVLVIGIHV